MAERSELFLRFPLLAPSGGFDIATAMVLTALVLT